MLIGLGANLICGIIVSALFLFYVLNRLRPNFQISKFICKIDSDPREDLRGTPRYTFKIVNKSKYTAFDAKIELFLMTPLPHIGSHQNIRMHPIEIRTSTLNSVPRYRKNYHKKDGFALFAILIHTNEPVFEMLKNEGDYLLLKVTVRHGLSSLAKTLEQQYGDISVINNDCKFGFAEDVTVMPISRTI